MDRQTRMQYVPHIEIENGGLDAVFGSTRVQDLQYLLPAPTSRGLVLLVPRQERC